MKAIPGFSLFRKQTVLDTNLPHFSGKDSPTVYTGIPGNPKGFSGPCLCAEVNF